MPDTWPIECDARMLVMLGFCVDAMAGMLQEDIDNGGGCGCGFKQLTVRQLKNDLKTANALVAAIATAEVNLAVKKHAARTKKKGKR
jgi:hypothetical protein